MRGRKKKNKKKKEKEKDGRRRSNTPFPTNTISRFVILRLLSKLGLILLAVVNRLFLAVTIMME